MNLQDLPPQPQAFWDERYAKQKERQRGKTGKILQDIVPQLKPQRVLELGCSTGDDSLWLAEQGWQVTAVDLSPEAIDIARRLAREAKLDPRIDFQALDLNERLPEGEFELVCAFYFQSPYEDTDADPSESRFPRIDILRRVSQRIVTGGHLLVVTHASAPPWSEHAQDFTFPTATGDWDALNLPAKQWEVLQCGQIKRQATGPDGQQAELEDNVIFVRRR